MFLAFLSANVFLSMDAIFWPASAKKSYKSYWMLSISSLASQFRNFFFGHWSVRAFLYLRTFVNWHNIDVSQLSHFSVKFNFNWKICKLAITTIGEIQALFVVGALHFTCNTSCSFGTLKLKAAWQCKWAHSGMFYLQGVLLIKFTFKIFYYSLCWNPALINMHWSHISQL
jgi:hypothetical protein